MLSGGIGVLAAAYPATRYLVPAGGTAAGDRVEIPADRLRPWTAERILLRGTPSFVVRTPRELFAVSGVCTHLGCIVNWQQGRRSFFCPCHGARFAPDGRVLGGPAPTPLSRFEATEAGGKILVRKA